MNKFLVILLFIIISCVQEEDREMQKIFYGNSNDEYFYLSSPENPNATIILMYGSAWMGNEEIPQHIYRAANYFQLENPNMAVALMQYSQATLENPARITQLKNIQRITEYVKDNISEKVFFYGTSSGAHIMSVYSSTHSGISAVAYIVPPMKFSGELTDIQEYYVQFLLGIPVNQITPEIYNQYKYLEPYYLANQNVPPTYIVAGSNDPLIPYQNTLDYTEKLDSLMVENYLETYEFGHASNISAELEYQIYHNISNFFKTK